MQRVLPVLAAALALGGAAALADTKPKPRCPHPFKAAEALSAEGKIASETEVADRSAVVEGQPLDALRLVLPDPGKEKVHVADTGDDGLPAEGKIERTDGGLLPS